MAKTPAVFLVKSEPYKYSFAQLCRDGQTRWDGVRNFEARNNLRAMRVGDLLLFYHSNEGKQIVGLARVITAAYPDPTAPGEDWSVVDVAPVGALKKPVTLATIKAEPRLGDMALIRRSRISVVPVTPPELTLLLQLAETKLPNLALPKSSASPVPLAPLSAPLQAAKSRPAKAAAAKPRSAKAASAKPRPTNAAAAESGSPKSAAAQPHPAKSAAAKPRPAKTTAAKSRPAKASAAKLLPTANGKRRAAAP